MSDPLRITADPQFSVHTVGPHDKVIMVVPHNTPDTVLDQFMDQFQILLGPDRAMIIKAPE